MVEQRKDIGQGPMYLVLKKKVSPDGSRTDVLGKTERCSDVVGDDSRPKAVVSVVCPIHYLLESLEL